MTPLEAAKSAAKTEFDAYLDANNAGAAMSVPTCVIEAAQLAYVRAGGDKAIKVCGHGNRTHPVCSIAVYIDNDKSAKLELAAFLERHARNLRR